MDCRYRVLLRCVKCLRVFCVPELAGSSVVWHGGECNDICERIACSDLAEHADRATVVWVEGDRLEVKCGSERQ